MMPTTMPESEYHLLVAAAFRRIEDGLEDVDPDLVEVTSTGDVVTLAFANGVRCVLNTQRPVRQIWLAAKAQAWHFRLDPETGRWVDDKDRPFELFSTLRSIIKEQAGIDVPLGA